MSYLAWLLRVLAFVLVLLFALNNTAPVSVMFYADAVLNNVPLIVVMLVAFIAGGVFVWLLALPPMLRRRRELARLRRKLEKMEDSLMQTRPPAPEAVAPLAPL